MAKLYVEQGDYEDAVEMTRKWEAALEEKSSLQPFARTFSAHFFASLYSFWL